MLDVYFCIRNEHDLRLLALAGLICVVASAATVFLLRHAQDGHGDERRRWLVVAGLVSGSGIWATHFVAMLGYDPGVVIGYELGFTIASLASAVAATTMGFALALRSRSRRSRLMAGAVVGLGIAGMHYLGMQAVDLPARIEWSVSYVAASILLAILPVVPSTAAALDHRNIRSGVVSAALLVSAILALHLTGMAAITLVPMQMEEPTAALLSSLEMGAAVAGTTFAVLMIATVAALMSAHTRAVVSAGEREFKVLVQGISDCAIYMLTSEGKVASWNAGAQRLKGYSINEALGLDLSRFYSPDERAASLPARGLEVARRVGKFNAEGWRYRKDGSRFWAHVTIESVYDERGIFKGFAKITRDMTKFKEHQDNLDAALSNMHQGLCLFDANERLVISNDRVGQIFNVSREQCPPGTSFEDVFRLGLERRAGGALPPAVLGEVMARHRACLATSTGGSLIVQFTEECTLSITHRRVADGGWVTTFDDITEQRRAEQRIKHMALHDGLTGLPNRLSYTERLDAELHRAALCGQRVAVIGIDLDRFKEVNDTYGHATGDAVLHLLAERMTGQLEADECVARFGGDEFAAFKAFDEDAELTAFLDRLHADLSAPVQLESLSITTGASIGVAIYPIDGDSREKVVNNADLAMYRAKDTIDRQICFYEQGMDEAARARRRLANDLRKAIDRDEFSVAYQVQKSVSTQAVTGFEALLRWQHPRDGWISPAEFIPIAEESGEIVRIGEWVLRAACKQAARWPEPWKVAVNISPIQLMHIGLIDLVTSALVEAGLPANRLELEITETAFVSDKVRALHILRQIKGLGVSIAIDDFGTGYSSLDTLNSFPFDKIKIDKSFLLSSGSSNQARAIIRAVLALGQSMEVPVLAEGLESEDQLRLLAAEGCDEAQGYLWGRPVAQPEETLQVGARGRAA